MSDEYEQAGAESMKREIRRLREENESLRAQLAAGETVRVRMAQELATAEARVRELAQERIAFAGAQLGTIAPVNDPYWCGFRAAATEIYTAVGHARAQEGE